MLLVTLVVFSLGIHFGLRQYFKASIQRELYGDAHSVVNDYLAHISEKGQEWALGELREAYPPTDDEPFVRLSTGSRVLLATQSANSTASILGTLPLARTVQPEGAFHRYHVAPQNVVMIYSLPYRAPDGRTYEVEMGESLAVSMATLGSLDKLLCETTPLILVIGVMGGYVLMKRPLRPLLVLTEKAENIGRNALGERLPVIPTADELERLTHSLNGMISRLEEAIAHNHRFSADASHELRTPLTIMRGEMEEMLQLPGLPAQAVENLISSLDEAERMSRIVSSLMVITRLEIGGEQIAREPLNLTALVRTTSEQMRLLALEKGFPLSFESEGEVWVHADPMRLKQMVVNLIDNAVKYTPQIDLLTPEEWDEGEGAERFGGTLQPISEDVPTGVSVRIMRDFKAAVLEITDNGVGISADALPHIFERFYRADYARTRSAGGVGLGLAIVKSILAAHDGTISARSEEGVGTTMHVELPLAASYPATQGAAARDLSATRV
jgi:signal transduction histidine kinase